MQLFLTKSAYLQQDGGGIPLPKPNQDDDPGHEEGVKQVQSKSRSKNRQDHGGI